MKNLLLLVVLMSFSVLLNAQTEVSSEVDQPTEEVKTTLSITMHFKNIADLKRFKTQQLEKDDLLKKVTINPDFTFAYTLGKPVKSSNANKDSYGLKVEIKDQDSRAKFLKELTDSIDGVITLYDDGYLAK